MRTAGRVEAISDFDAWATDQVVRLRKGLTRGLDREGLADAIQDILERRRASACASVRRVVASLLLCEALPPAKRSTTVADAIGAMHTLSAVLAPSLAGELQREYGRLYAAAMAMASEELRDLGGDPADLPQRPPWRWEDIFVSRSNPTT